MDKRKVFYKLHSGKNSKIAYYAKAYLREYTPRWLTRRRKQRLLKALDLRPDRQEILDRVAYYCKLSSTSPIDHRAWDEQAVRLDQQPVTRKKVYYFDAMEYGRYFSGDNRWLLLYGDITWVPELPTIVKSRPIQSDNQNSVLLNLNKVRHFLFVNDKKSWNEKRDMAVFRGDLGILKEIRNVFMNRWYGDAMIDAGMTNDEGEPEWKREKMTISEHLDYKFIMSLEGNDVASNLKWIMSSNSIAVSPRLTCETWFMEGQLIPDYHFILVKDDFSDLKERMQYYMDHPAEAEAIIRHAHEWVARFQEPKREKLVSLLVLKKYFEMTPQTGLK